MGLEKEEFEATQRLPEQAVIHPFLISRHKRGGVKDPRSLGVSE